MADAERVLRVVKQAAIQLRATHGRRGYVVHVEDADDVVVAGDLHGSTANLRKVLALARLDDREKRHLVLQEFVHGSGRYASGGCDSHQLLDVVSALKCQHPHRVHLLLGNHELSEWTGRAIAKSGVAMNELFAMGVETAYGDRCADMMEAYHDLFASMPLAVRTENRVFICHSVPNAAALDDFDVGLFDSYGVPEDQRSKGSNIYNLVWGRDLTDKTSARFAQMVDADLLITGHISVESGYAAPNSRRVIVDCSGDPAACVVFPTREPLDIERLVDCIHLLPGSAAPA